MRTFSDFTDVDLNLTVDAAMDKKDNLSENELQDILNKLYSEQTREGVIEEKKLIEFDFKTLLAQSDKYFQSTVTFTNEGVFGDFWNKFNINAKQIICKTQVVIDFINNDGKLKMKDALKYIIPFIVSALGFTALNPLTLAILVGILALIAKIGFNTYCGFN